MGTSAARAQPFLRPAAAEKAGAAFTAVAADMVVQTNRELLKLGIK